MVAQPRRRGESHREEKEAAPAASESTLGNRAEPSLLDGLPHGAGFVSAVTFAIFPENLLVAGSWSFDTAVSPSMPTSVPSSPENAEGCVFGMRPSPTFFPSTKKNAPASGAGLW